MIYFNLFILKIILQLAEHVCICTRNRYDKPISIKKIYLDSYLELNDARANVSELLLHPFFSF